MESFTKTEFVEAFEAFVELSLELLLRTKKQMPEAKIMSGAKKS